MSQKKDILEQIVEEYLTHKGYFVQHNIRYRPNSWRQTPSDIDVLAINPTLTDADRVFVVNVKSWQGGFDFSHQLARIDKNLKEGGKLLFRELTQDDWAGAFRNKIREPKQQVYIRSRNHSH